MKMQLYLIVLLCAIASVAYVNGDENCGSDLLCRSSLTYTINNNFFWPLFTKSMPMELRGQQPFLYYMEQAVERYTMSYRSFTATYYAHYGYFVAGINGLMGNWKDNRTYWEFSNATFGPLDQGVSTYIPSPGDKVLLNFTVDAH